LCIADGAFQHLLFNFFSAFFYCHSEIYCAGRLCSNIKWRKNRYRGITIILLTGIWWTSEHSEPELYRTSYQICRPICKLKEPSSLFFIELHTYQFRQSEPCIMIALPMPHRILGRKGSIWNRLSRFRSQLIAFLPWSIHSSNPKLFTFCEPIELG
jgi:hypothetical protein